MSMRRPIPPLVTIIIKGLPLGINGLWLQDDLQGLIDEGTVIYVNVVTPTPLSRTCLAFVRCDSTSTCLRVRHSLHKFQALFAVHDLSVSGPSVPGIEDLHLRPQRR